MCVYEKNRNLPPNVTFSASDKELQPATPTLHAAEGRGWLPLCGARGVSIYLQL